MLEYHTNKSVFFFFLNIGPFCKFCLSHFCTFEHRDHHAGAWICHNSLSSLLKKKCSVSNWLLVSHRPEDPGAWGHLVQCFAARNGDKVWRTAHWKTAGRAQDSSRKAKTPDAEEKQRIRLPDSSGEDGAAPAGSSGKKKKAHADLSSFAVWEWKLRPNLGKHQVPGMLDI